MKKLLLHIFFRKELEHIHASYEHEMAELSLDHQFEVLRIREEFRDKLQSLSQQALAATWSTTEAAQLSVHCEDPVLPRWITEASQESLALTNRIIAEHKQAIQDSKY